LPEYGVKDVDLDKQRNLKMKPSEQKCSHCKQVVPDYNLHVDQFMDGGCAYYHINCFLGVLQKRNCKLTDSNRRLRTLLRIMLEEM
jgi:hypothetical protein